MKGDIYRTKWGYQVRFGKEITRRFPANNLIGAERYLNFLRHQADEGIFDPRDHQVKRNPLGLKQQSTKWLKLKKKTVKPRSYSNLARYMRYACNYFGPKTNVKLIGYGQIEDFLFGIPKISDKTRANIKSCLHDFFKWVSKRERIPVPDFPETPFELGWRNIIDLNTQQNILNKIKEISYSINPRIFIGIKWLSTYIALRPNELISLREKQIDLVLGGLIVPHPKEKSPKIVYLLQEDIELAGSLPQGLPGLYYFRHPKGLKGAKAGARFGNRYLYKWWKRACDELGIKDVDLYGGTRHSTATALGAVCTPEEVKDATGHTSKAFERYFQNKQARALKVTRKIRKLRGEVVEFSTDKLLINKK
jgi:integrase